MGIMGEVLHDKMGLVLSVAFVIILILILLISSSARAQFKKAIFFLITIAILATGYYFVTSRSITEIPHLVNAFFNGPQVPETVSHKYYQDPERGAETVEGD